MVERGSYIGGCCCARGEGGGIRLCWRGEHGGTRGGRKRVVWWCGGRGKAKVEEEGRLMPLARRRLGDFDLRFFLADVLEMGWFVSCAVGELKGWRQDREIPSPTQTRPQVYTQSFILLSTATKIEEAGGSIPSFSS